MEGWEGLGGAVLVYFGRIEGLSSGKRRKERNERGGESEGVATELTIFGMDVDGFYVT